MSGESSAAPRERELFLGALALAGAAERAAYLTEACQGDLALRRRVERLLADAATLGNFLESPAVTRSSSPTVRKGAAPTETLAEGPGASIGPYHLLERIGEGGVGVVYLAEQQAPLRRQVALKIIKLGMDTRSVVARFEAERQALALMEHPNIARVLDGGATETGRPYFVMELVKGVKLTDYCDQNALPIEARLRLVVQVCQAIQHAHQKGIIHRDIKPSNILVTVNDPGSPGVPKVIDFGIAKATERSRGDPALATAQDAFMGTPAYMSPEQVQFAGADLDTRSDIYSLGALLYELLTGKTPFDPKVVARDGLDEYRRLIREQEPPRPSVRAAALPRADLTTMAARRHDHAPHLVRRLQGDLDWIVMKCLEKDRNQRYATANGLALDLEHYLDHQPVLARPPNRLDRLEKFIHRNRTVVAAASAITLTLILGAGFSLWEALRAERAEAKAVQAGRREGRLRRRAEREMAAAQLNEYIADIGLAHQSISDGNYGRALQLVEKHRPKAGQPDLRGFEWRYLWELCRGDPHVPFPTQEGSVVALAVAPDGHRLAVGLSERVRIYDLDSRELVATLPTSGSYLAFLPDGKFLLTANRWSVSSWRTGDWTLASTLAETGGPIAVSSDGGRLATQRAGRVAVWDMATWKEMRSIPGAQGWVEFSPEGGRLATGSRRGIDVWPLTGEGPPVRLEDSANGLPMRGPVFSPNHFLAFSGDGTLLAAPRNNGSTGGVFRVNVWETRSGKDLGPMPDDPQHAGHVGVISALARSPNGHRLVSASWDHSLRLWDFEQRRMIGAFQGHFNEVWAVAFLPDGERIVSGAKDGGVNLWSAVSPIEAGLLPDGWALLGLAADGRLAAAVNGGDRFGLFDLETHQAKFQFALGSDNLIAGRRPPGPLAISADLRVLARGGARSLVEFWDTQSAQRTAYSVPGGRLDFLSLSPDGHVLLTGRRGQPLRWWEPKVSTTALLNLEADWGTFSADGRTLAVLSRGNLVRLWDVPSRSLRRTLTMNQPIGIAAALSPDGQILATGGGIENFANPVFLWNTSSGKLLGEIVGHKQPVIAVAFAPDGRTLATAGADSALKLWNLATRQELLSLRRPGTIWRDLLFSGDGRLLLGRRGRSGPTGTMVILRAPAFGETDSPTQVRPSPPRSPPD